MLFWPDLGQITCNLKILTFCSKECCWFLPQNLTTKLYRTELVSNLFLRISNCYIGQSILVDLDPVPDWAGWRQHLGECISPHPSSPGQNNFIKRSLNCVLPEAPARSQCSQDQIDPRNCQGCHLDKTLKKQVIIWVGNKLASLEATLVWNYDPATRPV